MGFDVGVVSLPHGWGHGLAGTQLRVAAGVSGVNSNVLSDHRSLDPLSGTSVLTAIPVIVSVDAGVARKPVYGIADGVRH